MDFYTYVNEADAHFRYVRNNEDDTYRKGQAFFNYLEEADRSELGDEVIGTDRDPFYVDENLPVFLTYLKENW